MRIIKKFRLKRFQKKYEKLVQDKKYNEVNIMKIRKSIDRIIYNNKELRNVRRGVFETNSSSTHALVIHSLDYKEDDSGLYEEHSVSTGEFGWDFGLYTTPSSKLSYLLTYAYAMNDIDFYLLIKNTFPNFNIHLHILNGRLDDLKEYNGYIDHAGELDIDIFKNPDILKAFVFNEENFIVTSNDNDGEDIDGYIPEDAGIVIRKWN